MITNQKQVLIDLLELMNKHNVWFDIRQNAKISIDADDWDENIIFEYSINEEKLRTYLDEQCMEFEQEELTYIVNHMGYGLTVPYRRGYLATNECGDVYYYVLKPMRDGDKFKNTADIKPVYIGKFKTVSGVYSGWENSIHYFNIDDSFKTKTV